MKTIVITGASRGIGLETAVHLAAIGHRVIATARSVSGLEALYNRCMAAGSAANLVVIPADLTKPEHLAELCDRIVGLCPVVDVLINNAGGLINKAFTEISPEELHHIYDVNFFAPFALTQKLLPALLKSEDGHIVNIGSVGGITGSVKFGGLTAYSSSKGALATWSEVLAQELSGTPVSVNCLALGAAQTEMLSKAFPDFKAPLSATEMARYVAWFALNGHVFFNGKVLPVAVSTP